MMNTSPLLIAHNEMPVVTLVPSRGSSSRPKNGRFKSFPSLKQLALGKMPQMTRGATLRFSQVRSLAERIKRDLAAAPTRPRPDDGIAMPTLMPLFRQNARRLTLQKAIEDAIAEYNSVDSNENPFAATRHLASDSHLDAAVAALEDVLDRLLLVRFNRLIQLFRDDLVQLHLKDQCPETPIGFVWKQNIDWYLSLDRFSRGYEHLPYFYAIVFNDYILDTRKLEDSVLPGACEILDAQRPNVLLVAWDEIYLQFDVPDTRSIDCLLNSRLDFTIDNCKLQDFLGLETKFDPISLYYLLYVTARILNAPQLKGICEENGITRLNQHVFWHSDVYQILHVLCLCLKDRWGISPDAITNILRNHPAHASIIINATNTYAESSKKYLNPIPRMNWVLHAAPASNALDSVRRVSNLVASGDARCGEAQFLNRYTSESIWKANHAHVRPHERVYHDMPETGASCDSSPESDNDDGNVG